jgi:N-acetylmuramoyl-L-alanine amidase
LEKETVLFITRIVRIELERQGFRVVMTRNDDTNPSYDDRAALANAHRDAIFISIHVSSTGTIGTAHTYFYSFSSPLQAATGPDSFPAPAARPGGLTLWEEAQRPYADASRHFAELLEIQLAQRFPGSPATPSPAAVRELRSIALPAVAVELSSILASESSTLISMAPPLATSIVRGIQAFRAAGPAGAN